MSTPSTDPIQDYIVTATRTVTGQPGDFTRPDDPPELPAYDDNAFWEGRTVSGTWLAEWLTHPDTSVHRRPPTTRGSASATASTSTSAASSID